MKRHSFFLAIMITLAIAVGMIIIEKLKYESAIQDCARQNKTWNYMEAQCEK